MACAIKRVVSIRFVPQIHEIFITFEAANSLNIYIVAWSVRNGGECRLIPVFWRSFAVFVILYSLDCASRYKFLLMTNLTHFFMYFFISSLYMFRALQCSSSGDQIILIHHLVWLVCVCRYAWYAGQEAGIPSSHLHRLIIQDDVLIQFDLLMMSTVMLETCRKMK